MPGILTRRSHILGSGSTPPVVTQLQYITGSRFFARGGYVNTSVSGGRDFITPIGYVNEAT